MKYKTCTMCGKNKSLDKFPSNGHGGKAAACMECSHKKIKWEKKSRQCKWCTADFFPKTRNQLYCSIECRRSHYLHGCEEQQYYRIRWQILLRDNFTCQYCGATPQEKAKLHVDHIVPKSKDGTNSQDNLITSCAICNFGKSDVLLEENEIKKIKQLKNRKAYFKGELK